MISLSKLTPEEKPLFLERLVKAMKKTVLGKSCFLMQGLMEGVKKPLPQLYDLAFIEKDPAFHQAYTYLSQKGIADRLPALEHEGQVYQEMPSIKLIQKILGWRSSRCS